MIPWIIGFAGGSGSGKSTAVQLVADHFRAEGIEAAVMSTDAYYKDQSHLPEAQRAMLNYDTPRVIDLAYLRENLIRLRDGVWTVDEPQYDFKTHTRMPDPVLRIAKPVMFVDGLFAFMVDDDEPVLHYRVFIDTKAAKCLERRLRRDITERGRSRKSVIDQWKATVHPGYIAHVLPQKARARRVIDWDHDQGENEKKAAQLFHYLHQHYNAFRAENP